MVGYVLFGFVIGKSGSIDLCLVGLIVDCYGFCGNVGWFSLVWYCRNGGDFGCMYRFGYLERFWWVSCVLLYLKLLKVEKLFRLRFLFFI